MDCMLFMPRAASMAFGCRTWACRRLQCINVSLPMQGMHCLPFFELSPRSGVYAIAMTISTTSTLPTVDVQDLSGDEWCRVEKEDGVGNIAGVAHVADRVKSSKRFVSFRCVHWRLHDPWGDGVHADALPRVFDRE